MLAEHRSLAAGAEMQLGLLAEFPDGSSRDIAAHEASRFASDDRQFAKVSHDGLLSARPLPERSRFQDHIVTITAWHGERSVSLRFLIAPSSDDVDGDGIPNDCELRHDMDPLDPNDASEDRDGDGLDALGEFRAGSDLDDPDTDGDGLLDGEDPEPLIPRVNEAPVVSVGPDLQATMPSASVHLTGIASDDGLPDPPGALRFSWRLVAGPDGSRLDDAHAALTTAHFAVAGDYLIELRVSDGELAAADQLLVTVLPATVGGIRQLSLGLETVLGDGDSFEPALSGDGRYVAFSSDADNLVADDQNGVSDVFVLDRSTGIITRVSIFDDGSERYLPSEAPQLSGDGRYVVYLSSPAISERGDLILHDRIVGSSVAFARNAHAPRISGDGTTVAFVSAEALAAADDNGVDDVYVIDLSDWQTERVSVARDGRQARLGGSEPVLSHDGQLIAFSSLSDDLVGNDLNGLRDVFLHERDSGATRMLSMAADGTPGDGASSQPALSTTITIASTSTASTARARSSS